MKIIVNKLPSHPAYCMFAYPDLGYGHWCKKMGGVCDDTKSCPFLVEMKTVIQEAMKNDLATTLQENKPLTIDEMNHLNHEPIYIKHLVESNYLDGWHIATSSSYTNHGFCDLEIDNGNKTINMNNYGKTWLAYRKKPPAAS